MFDKLQFVVSKFGDKLKLVGHTFKKREGGKSLSREALAAFADLLGYSRRLPSLISPSRSAWPQALRNARAFLTTKRFEDSLVR